MFSGAGETASVAEVDDAGNKKKEEIGKTDLGKLG